MLTVTKKLSTAILLATIGISGLEPLRVNALEPLPINTYQAAREELTAEHYTLYRIVERIARANSYDNGTWRVAVVPAYDPNGFGTGINLIAIERGVFQQIAGDSSALACIIAHEMGHQVKRHIPITETRKNEYIAQIRAEVEREVSEKRPQRSLVGSAVRVVGGAIANRVLPGLLGNLVGGMIGNSNNPSSNQRQIEQLVATRTQELEQHLQKQAYNQELEADEIAYLASVRAGFEEKGCLRAMQVLASFSARKPQPNQPKISTRIAAIQTLMAKHSTSQLQQEGKERILRSQPLTYQLGEDRKLLRINPRYGGSAIQDIDRLFGS